MDFIFSISGSLRMTVDQEELIHTGEGHTGELILPTGEGLDPGSWGENKFQVTKTKRNQARS